MPPTEPLDRVPPPVRLSLADSLAVWIEEHGLSAGIAEFERLRGDTIRWFVAEDWEYGDLTTLGQKLLGEKQFDAAVEVLKAAALAYPASYRPHLWLARAYERLGRSQEANTARQVSISLNPKLLAADRRAAIELRGGIPLSYRFLDQLFDKGVGPAARDYRMLKANNPGRVEIDPLILVRGGQQLREAGQLVEAREPPPQGKWSIRSLLGANHDRAATNRLVEAVVVDQHLTAVLVPNLHTERVGTPVPSPQHELELAPGR